MRSSIAVHGWIEVLEHDAISGALLSHFRGPNRVTDVGVTLMAERLRGNTAFGGISHYALGGSATPPVAGDTALISELYRNLVTLTRVSAGVLTITLHLGVSQGNGFTFREGGAFNPDNMMLCRAVFPDKVKTSSKELSIIHTINIAVP